MCYAADCALQPFYCIYYSFLYILNVSGSEKGGDSSDKCNSENKGAQSDICTNVKEEVEVQKDSVDFKVIYNKNKYDVNFPLDSTVSQLKQHLQDIIGIVGPANQNGCIV
jgi:hypothetical protein